MIPLTCVVYHNIGVETKFEAGLGVTTSPENFRAQIDWLGRNYNIVDIGTVLKGVLPPKPLLITFDDCYASVLEAARNVLSPLGLPSVFFINPGLLGPDAISLDSVMAWCAAKAGVAKLAAAMGAPAAGSVSELIASHASKLSATARLALKDNLRASFGLASLDGRSPLLGQNGLTELQKHGVEIGNHTSTHVHCRSLDQAEMASELTGARQELERLCGTRVRCFAMPYGNEADLTPQVLAHLRHSGHEAIFLVQARSNRFRPAADIWYRVSLQNDAAGSLTAKLRRKPILRSLKHMIGL